MYSLPTISHSHPRSPKELKTILDNLRFIADSLEREGGRQHAAAFRQQARLLQQLEQ